MGIPPGRANGFFGTPLRPWTFYLALPLCTHISIYTRAGCRHPKCTKGYNYSDLEWNVLFRNLENGRESLGSLPVVFLFQKWILLNSIIYL